MPVCEIKLNQLLQKNPGLINCLNRFNIYPINENTLTFHIQKIIINIMV